jgi:hypothetical protein
MSGKAVKTLPVWGHREFIESKNMDYTYGSPKYLWLSNLKNRDRDDD